jgi:large subunit ribosomal protein LP2
LLLHPKCSFLFCGLSIDVILFHFPHLTSYLHPVALYQPFQHFPVLIFSQNKPTHICHHRLIASNIFSLSYLRLQLFVSYRSGLAQPMRYIAAYILAQLGGDSNPSKAKITAIIESAGVSADGAAIDALLSKIAGKKLADVISEGSAKLSLVGGGASGSAGAGAGVSSTSTPEASPAAPTPEPKKEEEAVVDLAGGFDDLFG